jgi:hypothetical protein
MGTGVKLPTDPTERKKIPIYSGVLAYFPNALAEVAKVSVAGNEQHNGVGTPLHWDRSKSMDQEDAIMLHLMQNGEKDEKGMRHSAYLAWRSLALLELELEAERTKEAPGTQTSIAEQTAKRSYIDAISQFAG